MLMAYAFHYETPHDKYQQINSTQVVRLANAMGINEDGEIIDSAGLAQFTNKLLKNTSDRISQLACRHFQHTDWLHRSEVYLFVSFYRRSVGTSVPNIRIGKALCMVQGFDLYKACDDIFVNKNFVYVDGYGREHGYVGEDDQQWHGWEW